MLSKFWRLVAVLFALVCCSTVARAESPQKTTNATAVTSPLRKRYDALRKGDPDAIKASMSLVWRIAPTYEQWEMWAWPVAAGAPSKWVPGGHWQSTDAVWQLLWYGVNDYGTRYAEEHAERNRWRTKYQQVLGALLAATLAELNGGGSTKGTFSQNDVRSAYKTLYGALADMPMFQREDAGEHVDLERLAWAARKAGVGDKDAVALCDAYSNEADYVHATKTAYRYGLRDQFEAAVEGVNAAPKTKPAAWDIWVDNARKTMKAGKNQAWDTGWAWDDGVYDRSCTYEESSVYPAQEEDTTNCHRVPVWYPYDPRDKPLFALDLQPF